MQKRTQPDLCDATHHCLKDASGSISVLDHGTACEADHPPRSLQFQPSRIKILHKSLPRAAKIRRGTCQGFQRMATGPQALPRDEEDDEYSGFWRDKSHDPFYRPSYSSIWKFYDCWFTIACFLFEIPNSNRAILSCWCVVVRLVILAALPQYKGLKTDRRTGVRWVIFGRQCIGHLSLRYLQRRHCDASDQP